MTVAQQELCIGITFIVGAYLLGGIPFGFLIGKARGVDVRKVGSKNIGATNVFRTVGKGWGLLAFLLDVMKGMLPTFFVKAWVNDPELYPNWMWLPLVVGITTVIGHMLTPYMKFKGGKGVATAFGMLIALMPAVVGIAFLIFAIVFAMFHYISLGSCMAALFLAIAVWFPMLGIRGYEDIPQCILVTAIAAFIIWKHRSNIVRLINGTENKIYLFKRKQQ